ncbi:MAG: hypothetical protein WD404_08120 [Solirubrobacterales bacterium]
MELMDMSRGLKARAIAIWAGTVVMAVTLKVTNTSPDTAGSVILLYAFITAIYFAYFLTKPEDEVPTQSSRD